MLVLIAIGGVLVLVGLVLLVRGWIGDRSRGRLRCPGCWYALTEASGERTTCSECGRAGLRQRDLTRPRRGRRSMALGAITLLIGAATGTAPLLRDHWTGFAPTWVLIVALPYQDDPRAGAWLALKERLGGSDVIVYTSGFGPSRAPLRLTEPPTVLFAWERRLLAHRCAGVFRSDASRSLDGAAFDLLHWLEGDAAPALDAVYPELAGEFGSIALSVVEAAAPESVDAVPWLRRVIRQENGVSWRAVEMLGRIGPKSAPAVPELLAIIEGPSYFAHTAATTLGQIGPSAADAVPALNRIANDRERRADERAACLKAIAMIDPTDPDALRLSRLLILHPSTDLRHAAAAIARATEENASIVRADLVEHLGSGLTFDALRGFMSLGPASTPAIDEIRPFLDAEVAVFRMFAVTALGNTGSSSVRADLERMLHDPDSLVVQRARSALEQLAMTDDRETR